MDEVNSIVEVIKEGEIVRMPESRALEEDLFILRRVIGNSEVPSLTDLAIKKQKDIPAEYQASSRLEVWKTGKTNWKKNMVVDELIENFHWHIARTRRTKGISRKQLAEMIEISEEDMKKIEFGELPSDDYVIISKIEEKLGCNLRKEKRPESPKIQDLQKMKEDQVREEIDKAGLGGKVRSEGRVTGSDIELLD